VSCYTHHINPSHIDHITEYVNLSAKVSIALQSPCTIRLPSADNVSWNIKELEEWLESSTSKESGWHAEGEEGGETVGHDSGRKIVEILRSNPDKVSFQTWDAWKARRYLRWHR
jgi:hypothetical protein